MVSTRKGIILIIVFAVAAALVTPHLASYATKSSIERLFHQISTETPLTVEVTNYHNGWLSSSADVQVTLDSPTINAEWQRLIVHEGLQGTLLPNWHIHLTIQNGPVLIAMDRSGGLHWHLGRGYAYGEVVYSDSTAKLLTHLLGVTPTVKTGILIGMAGNYHIDIENQGIRYLGQEKMRINWGGYTAHILVDPNFRHIDEAFNILPINAVTPEFSLQTTAPVSFHDAINRSFYQLNLHDLSLTIPNFKSVIENNTVTLQDLQFNIKNTLAGDRMNGSVQGDLTKFSFNDKSAGPGHLAFNVRAIDAEIYGQIQKTLRGLNGDQQLSPRERQLQGLALLPRFIGILAKGGEVDLQKAELNLPEGLLKLQGKLAMKTDPQVKVDMVGLSSLKEFAKSGQASFSVDVPEKLLARIVKVFDGNTATPSAATNVPVTATAATTTPASTTDWQARLQGWQQAGWLIKNGDEYQLSVSYDGGVITVNNKKLPFALPVG